jgi:hypothetical protein
VRNAPGLFLSTAPILIERDRLVLKRVLVRASLRPIANRHEHAIFIEAGADARDGS